MSKTEPMVMLIDDSQVDLFLNKKFLNISNISDNVFSFLSARNALQYIEDNIQEPENLPNLILLDIKMPDINGFQFLEHFKKLQPRLKKDIKIVMLSSSIDPKDLSRAKSSEHVFDILKKPLNPNELKALLKDKNVKWVA